MACETLRKRNQTLAERIAEVQRVVNIVNAGLVSGRVRAKVGPQGAVVFDGLTASERDDVTDACIYRRIVGAGGNPVARAALQRAEMLAGRAVNPTTVAQGVHSHDGGVTWHKGH